MFSREQDRLLSRAYRLGYGYAKFAASVRGQGSCSAGQEAALKRMLDRVDAINQGWDNPWPSPTPEWCPHFEKAVKQARSSDGK